MLHRAERTLPQESASVGTRRRASLLVVLSLLTVAWFVLRVPTRWEYDSMALYEGIRELVWWWRAGAEGLPQRVGYFAPFQYLTGLPLVAASMAGVGLDVFGFWAWCSALSFGGLIWLTYGVCRRAASAGAAWAVVAVLLSGPLVTYAPSTYLELTAALLTAVFAIAATGRAGTLLCLLLFWLASLTKETAAPLLLVLWVAGTWIRRVDLGRAGVMRHAAAMAAGLVLGLGSHAALNLLRFGTVWNQKHFSPGLIVDDWTWRGQYFVSLWLAPNGGVVPFWPALVLTASGVLAWVAVCSARRPRGHVDVVPALAVLVLLGGLTAGLSSWFSPFGWWSWGPRLVLPWLPASFLLLARAYPAGLDRLARRALTPPASCALVAALLALATLPHVLMPADPTVVPGFFNPAVASFKPDKQWTPQRQHDEIMYLAWRHVPPLLVRPLPQLTQPGSAAPAAMYIAAMLGLLLNARRLLSEPSTEAGSAASQASISRFTSPA